MMKWSLHLVILLLVLSLSGFAFPAFADIDFPQAVAALRAGEYETAAQAFGKLAENGHAESQYLLAIMHLKGRGLPRKPLKAAYWFRQAAEQNHSKSQLHLGMMHYQGEFLPKDLTLTVFWLRRAANNGLAKAQDRLGSLYALGQGLDRDLAQAHLWYSRAEKLGFKLAQKHRRIVTKKMAPNELDQAHDLYRERWPATKK